MSYPPYVMDMDHVERGLRGRPQIEPAALGRGRIGIVSAAITT